MSRERRELDQAQTLKTAGDASVHWQRVVDETDGDVRLICHSPERAVKESAMTDLQRKRFEKQIETGFSRDTCKNSVDARPKLTSPARSKLTRAWTGGFQPRGCSQCSLSRRFR